MQKTYFATTFQSRCKDAARYVDQYKAEPNSYWIAIGKPSSWADDSNPPYPALTVNRVPELIGFVYIHTCSCIYPAEDGIININDQTFAALSTTNPSLLASAKANRVYFEGLLLPGSIPVDSSYRIQALCTDVLFNSTPPSTLGAGLFLPASAIAQYFVDWVSYFEPVTNDGQTQQVIQIIKEF